MMPAPQAVSASADDGLAWAGELLYAALLSGAGFLAGRVFQLMLGAG